MSHDEFLSFIYSGLKVGMTVLVPKRISRIVEINSDGDIVYLIKESYKKSVTREELSQVYDELLKGSITTPQLREIATSAKTCNVTTIKWILLHLNLVQKVGHHEWSRTW